MSARDLLEFLGDVVRRAERDPRPHLGRLYLPGHAPRYHHSGITGPYPTEEHLMDRDTSDRAAADPLGDYRNLHPETPRCFQERCDGPHTADLPDGTTEQPYRGLGLGLRNAVRAGSEPGRAPAGTCDRGPAGWYCTRERGHDGPCPLWPTPEDTTPLEPALLEAGPYRVDDPEAIMRLERPDGLAVEVRVAHPALSVDTLSAIAAEHARNAAASVQDNLRTARCPDRSPTGGYQCEQPFGHPGAHENPKGGAW